MTSFPIKRMLDHRYIYTKERPCEDRERENMVICMSIRAASDAISSANTLISDV